MIPPSARPASQHLRHLRSPTISRPASSSRPPPLFSWTLSHDATSTLVGPYRTLARGDIVSSPKRLQRLRSLAGLSPTTRPQLQSDRIAFARANFVPSPQRPPIAGGGALPSLHRRGLSVVRLKPDCELGLVPATPALQRRATPWRTLPHSCPHRSVASMHHASFPSSCSAWPCAETSPSTSLGRTTYFRWEPCLPK